MENHERSSLLGPQAIRELSRELGVHPTKKLGQNFVHDGGTVRRIVVAAGVNPGDAVVEIGPGLGSLTLGLLEAGAQVCAIEIDPVLAQALPNTVATRNPEASSRFRVVESDALKIMNWQQCAPEWPEPTRLVANLPYNVAVPILLYFLELLPSLERTLVMVQAEVADRLVAGPGSRTYGVPSVKAAWYGAARRAGSIGRNVFWPAPNVDSALVDIQIDDVPRGGRELRLATFKIVDVAFAQRRKMLRAALRAWVGDTDEVALLLEKADVDPTQRGETLTVDDFQRLGEAALALPAEQTPLLSAAIAHIASEARYA